MMAPITAASYVLKAIVLTSYVIETPEDSQAKGARGTLHHYHTPRCSKSFSTFKDETTGAVGNKMLLVTEQYRSPQCEHSVLASISSIICCLKTELYQGYFLK